MPTYIAVQNKTDTHTKCEKCGGTIHVIADYTIDNVIHFVTVVCIRCFHIVTIVPPTHEC